MTCWNVITHEIETLYRSWQMIDRQKKGGGRIFCAIDPEWAVHTHNYVLNYRLLELVRKAILSVAFAATVGLWFLTCFFVLKAKRQSYGWLFLAIFGPLGFIVLTILKDKALDPRDLYRRLVSRMNLFLRVAYELSVVYLVWDLAYQLMVWKRDILIERRAAATGVSIAQIVDQQNASGGMWAFSEGLEVLYLVPLLYLLGPLVFNLVDQTLQRLRPMRYASPPALP